MQKRAMKFMSSILIGVLFLNSLTPATIAVAATVTSESNAVSVLAEGTRIVENRDGSITVNDGKNISTITVTEDEHFRTVYVVDKAAGITNKFIFDKELGTVYSSYTGQTIEGTPAENARLRTRAAKSTKKTYTFSWKKIRQMVGASSGVGAVIGGILAVTGATTAAKGISAIVTGVLTAFSNVIPEDSHHGLKVTVTTTKHFRNKNHIPYRTTKNITGISVY